MALGLLLSLAVAVAAQIDTFCPPVPFHGFPDTCPSTPTRGPNSTIGVCTQDFDIIGSGLEAVHESIQAPTGLAVDSTLNVYLTYPRNSGPTPKNVVLATSFTEEEPWPSADIQNCTPSQNISECFINVQNVVLDSLGQMWVIDSGIAPGQSSAVLFGTKVMSFNVTTRELIRTYFIPESLLYENMNANDLRINNTLGTNGYAFITDASAAGSLITINLDDGSASRRLFNTTVTRADRNFVGSYNGRPLYGWNGTTKLFPKTGSDGIALASGNVYWGVLASRRYYFILQSTLVDDTISDKDMLDAVQDPGQLGSEQAGFTADDRGRVYIMASEHNAIYYVDTVQSEMREEVNGVAPGGSGLVATENYMVKTLVRSGLIQHADSAAIMDGWLYFCTNQLALSPARQYNNVDARKGPFRSYRTRIGRGPAA
ncbi:major royal jelly protein-domain-containing protein [Pseudomassariella vexata]|uniref:Major royal jelly protein-domain-containing protein n=1 Tax=Pseudomassariella vexata TaxID=1141098 RepID=A0A1Y2DJC7_9PEZI|nr:major royal jelly protein-domain-containing protein [Pseudomassariella vexata]ORY59276.1 major royal jelly protein-domain-containing protein [Pseudomassariella vexata]